MRCPSPHARDLPRDREILQSSSRTRTDADLVICEVSLSSFCLPDHSREMTIQGKRHSRIFLLPLEGGSIHASPFPWKGLPSPARRGWLPFAAAKPPPLCLPHAWKALLGKRYSRFFIHPTQKRPSLTSGRFYVYYLLKETPIKSQNSI